MDHHYKVQVVLIINRTLQESNSTLLLIGLQFSKYLTAFPKMYFLQKCLMSMWEEFHLELPDKKKTNRCLHEQFENFKLHRRQRSWLAYQPGNYFNRMLCAYFIIYIQHHADEKTSLHNEKLFYGSVLYIKLIPTACSIISFKIDN